MKDEQFEELLKELKGAYRRREFDALSEGFAHGVLKRVRYAKARKSQEAAETRSLLEGAIVRFASGAAACAFLVLIYGDANGIGLTGVTDIIPQSSVEFVLHSGVLL